MIMSLARITFGLLVLCLLAPAQGYAQSDEGLVPPVGAATEVDTQELQFETHPPIRLTPDKSELIHLEKDAASIVVGNPAHIGVLMDTPQLLVIVPRVPGASHFTVLDIDGRVIMQRHVIVASPKNQYIRLRSTCMGFEEGDCIREISYYCPDICHPIAPYVIDDGGSEDGAEGMDAPEINAEDIEEAAQGGE